MEGNLQLLKIDNGEMTIKSTDLVEIINQFREMEGSRKELRHCDFMAKIKKELEVLKTLGLRGLRNISESCYINSQGKKQPCFELNRDGMLQMLNSESVLVRYKTIEYISKLEKQMKEIYTASYMIDDPIKRAERWIEEEKQRAKLKQENDIMKPKASGWDKFLDSNSTYTFTDTSKLISTMAQEEKSDISISVMKLTQFLREQGVLSKAKSPDKTKEDGSIKKGSYKNLPNKQYEDYFNVISVDTGSFQKLQTRVKPEGVEYIYSLLKDTYSKTA